MTWLAEIMAWDRDSPVQNPSATHRLVPTYLARCALCGRNPVADVRWHVVHEGTVPRFSDPSLPWPATLLRGFHFWSPHLYLWLSR